MGPKILEDHRPLSIFPGTLEIQAHAVIFGCPRFHSKSDAERLVFLGENKKNKQKLYKLWCLLTFN